MSDQPVTCDVPVGLVRIPRAPACFWCAEPMHAMQWSSADGRWHIAQIVCPACWSAGPRPMMAAASDLIAFGLAIKAFMDTKNEGARQVIVKAMDDAPDDTDDDPDGDPVKVPV